MFKLLTLIIFIFHCTFAHAAQEYHNGCKSFYNIKWAYSYFKVAKDSQIKVERPVMVNYAAGYEPPNFQATFEDYQLKLFQSLNYEVSKRILEKSIEQSVLIYYLIDTQKLPSSGRTINHMLEFLPGWISKNYCRHYCENEAELKRYVELKIKELKNANTKRYSFSALASLLNDEISSINTRIENKEFNNYEEYLASYFLLFQGQLGVLMLTPKLQGILGGPISFDDFYKGVTHDSNIEEEDIEDGYKDFLKMIKENWSKMGNLITSTLKNRKNIDLDQIKYSDIEVMLNDEVRNFSKYALFAPDIVASVFRDNTHFSNNYCLIYDLVDNVYVTQGSHASGDSSLWYLAPILLAVFFIPLIVSGGAFFAVSGLFYGLTAITVADIGTKAYKLYKDKQEKDFAHFLTSLSSREKFQMQQLFELKAQLIKDGKTIGTLLALELIGLGIASKVIKVTEKVFKKMSKVDMIDDVINASLRNDSVGKNLRLYLAQKDIPKTDIASSLMKYSDEELFDFMMKIKSVSIGKKVLASEATIEGLKQTYVYSNSSIYGEINPAKILFDAITNKYLNNSKQYEIDRMIDQSYIMP